MTKQHDDLPIYIRVSDEQPMGDQMVKATIALTLSARGLAVPDEIHYDVTRDNDTYVYTYRKEN